MGATSSHPASHPPSRALHILRVTPSSPASNTDIEPFFDFVVGIDGDSLASNIDAASLERIVEAHEEKTLSLLVWNSKTRNTRVVPVVPSRTWSQIDGPQSPSTQPSLLGLSMRLCEPELALDNVWHVLEVLEGSPAESAGLVPYGDWIVGWSGGVLAAEGDFYDVVESHIDKPLTVYVYSYDFDTLREVVLVPNRQWGGDGLLGCGVGFGLLHRIPPPADDQSAAEQDGQEVNNNGKHELFVPADEVPQSAGFGFSGGGDYFHAPEFNHGAPFDNAHEQDHFGHSHAPRESENHPQPSNGHSLPPDISPVSPVFTAHHRPSQASFSGSAYAPRPFRRTSLSAIPGISESPSTNGRSTPVRNLVLPGRVPTPTLRSSSGSTLLNLHASAHGVLTEDDDNDDDNTSVGSRTSKGESSSLTSVD